MPLTSIRYNPTQLQLKDWSLVKVTGDDRESFLQGQVTNDLSSLSLKQGQLSARLSRTGKLQSFFFIAKLSHAIYLLCPTELVSKIKEDLEKYIIMEEVFLEDEQGPFWLRFNSFLQGSETAKDYFDFNFYGLNARLVFEKHPHLPATNEAELEEIRVLNGWPKWKQDVDEALFINDSFLNEIAISYKKGCFLGQETVAKIENNRGAAFYPVLLKLSEPVDLSSVLKTDFFIEERKAGALQYQINGFLLLTLFRDFRVHGKELDFSMQGKKIKGTVLTLPYYSAFSRQEIALELYHLGAELFQAGKLQKAMKSMERALAFDPALADAYESLGVMLGRVDQYDEAIKWMDKLLEVNPQSVMAHTNKSLFLMKLGKIEEAEAEKSLATVKSFAMYGEEARQKKQLAEEQKKKEEENLRREKMFLQVLEIDDTDTIALYGMADLFYQRKEYQAAIENLEKVVLYDSKYSTAYLLLGKAYEAIHESRKARDIYQKGIVVASKRGDMMPANEMQSRLNKLVMSASLG